MRKFTEIVQHFKDSVLKTRGSLNLVNNASSSKQIQRVIYYKETERLIIKPSGNRFCKNIGHNHKRNGIFFVIDIDNFTYT